MLLADTGGQMKGADAELPGYIAERLGIALPFGIARDSAGHKGSVQDALYGAFFMVSFVVA